MCWTDAILRSALSKKPKGEARTMNILVTGGAGYCGSFAARALLAAGHRVVVFDSLYQGHRAAVPDDAAFVQGDLRDAGAVGRLFAEHKGFDGIMHFASFTLAGESMQQP